MDVIENICVQDMIDRLMEVEDKTQPFKVDVFGSDGFNEDYEKAELVELISSDKKPYHVELAVFLKEPQDGVEEDGQEDSDDLYLPEHRFCNQLLVIDGIPVNPTLRPGFDNTDNDSRDSLEKSDWWGKPFITATNWEVMSETYQAYKERLSQYDDMKIESESEFNKRMDKQKTNWFNEYSSGTRFNIRCLDGGAWDRSTNCGFTESLDDALNLAKSYTE